jgi:hypothetical protein
MAYRMMGRLHALALSAGRGEAGQGTVEYVGLILLVGSLIAAMVAATRTHDWNLAKTIVGKLKNAIDTAASDAKG